MVRLLRWWRTSARAAPPAGSVLPGGWVPAAAPVSPVPDPPCWNGDTTDPAGPAELDRGTPRATSPRVGLVFGDGTHLMLDEQDPRAESFARLADELHS